MSKRLLDMALAGRKKWSSKSEIELAYKIKIARLEAKSVELSEGFR
jgi:hypothetical protein